MHPGVKEWDNEMQYAAHSVCSILHLAFYQVFSINPVGVADCGSVSGSDGVDPAVCDQLSFTGLRRDQSTLPWHAGKVSETDCAAERPALPNSFVGRTRHGTAFTFTAAK